MDSPPGQGAGSYRVTLAPLARLVQVGWLLRFWLLPVGGRKWRGVSVVSAGCRSCHFLFFPPLSSASAERSTARQRGWVAILAPCVLKIRLPRFGHGTGSFNGAFGTWRRRVRSGFVAAPAAAAAASLRAIPVRLSVICRVYEPSRRRNLYAYEMHTLDIPLRLASPPTTLPLAKMPRVLAQRARRSGSLELATLFLPLGNSRSGQRQITKKGSSAGGGMWTVPRCFCSASGLSFT